MFDVGFWEICMVGLISLLVIGPERLPKAARLAGFWVGKSQRIIASVKQEISQELKAEELRQLLKEQNLAGELKQIENDIKSASSAINSTVKQMAETDHQASLEAAPPQAQSKPEKPKSVPAKANNDRH